MHPHTRRKTKKRLGRLTPRNNAVPGFVPYPSDVLPAVSSGERASMAGALAYFQARWYRDAAPGDVREEDVDDADAAIAALFKAKDEE